MVWLRSKRTRIRRFSAVLLLYRALLICALADLHSDTAWPTHVKRMEWSGRSSDTIWQWMREEWSSRCRRSSPRGCAEVTGKTQCRAARSAFNEITHMILSVWIWSVEGVLLRHFGPPVGVVAIKASSNPWCLGGVSYCYCTEPFYRRACRSALGHSMAYSR